MKFVPRSYQGLGIHFLMSTPRGGLFAQPGLGKTVMALTAVDKLRLVGATVRTLVVAPKRVIDTEGWQRELVKWDHLEDLAIEPLVGTSAVRSDKLRSDKPIHLINYELLPWLLDRLVTRWPYDMVFLDESTKVKSHDSTWFKGNPRAREPVAIGSTLRFPDGTSLLVGQDAPSRVPGNTRVRLPLGDLDVVREVVPIEFMATPGLRHVAGKTKRWVNLTGTPMPNGVKDMWSPMYLLDGGRRLGENITRFREQYQVPHPRVRHVWIDQAGALDRVIDQTKDICMSIKAADYLDLPDLIPNVVAVRLPEALMEDYKTLEEEFFLQLAEHTIEAVNSAVLGGKLLQFCAGFLYTDKLGHWQEIHRVKLDALEELLDEVGGAAIVAFHFEADKQRLLKAIKGSVLFDGTVKMIEAFAAGKIRHLLLHPGSAGHGVEGLQDGTDTLIFFGANWNAEDHDQVIERIGPTRQLQSGHPRPVFVHYLTARDTMDELVLQRLIEKKSIQEILMNALRKRNAK